MRRQLVMAGAGVVALLGSFGAGRYSRAGRVVTVDKVRTEVQYRDRVQTQVVHDVQTVHDVATRTVTRWETVPGKPAVVVQTVERQAETRAQARTEAHQDAQSEAHATTVELHTTATVYARPAWSATALVGGQLGGRRLVDALPAPLVVGVSLERRILGPVSAGLWATSGLAGGLSVRVDW